MDGRSRPTTLRQLWPRQTESLFSLLTKGFAIVNLFAPHALAFASALSTRQICVIVKDGDGYSSESASIASSLNIPLLSEEEFRNEDFTHTIHVLPYESTFCVGISAEAEASTQGKRNSNRKERTSKQNSKPFVIDFCPPKSATSRSGPDLLLKAAFPKKMDSDLTVCDLTAGFGQDSLVMALGGAKKVAMVERDPVVSALLSDALRRLRILVESSEDPSRAELACKLSRKLSLQSEEAIDVLQSMLEKDIILPDVVYLDPMFPPRTKSAAVKKNMQILHGLLDTQSADNSRLLEEQRLIHFSMEAAELRVVVKRPLRAEPLGGCDRMVVPQPSFAIKGSTNRWDVYLK